MTPPPPPFELGDNDTIICCDPLTPNYPSHSLTAIQRPCDRCGRVLELVEEDWPVAPGARLHYLCLACVADMLPRGIRPRYTPATRARLERERGPIDWEAQEQDFLEHCRSAD